MPARGAEFEFGACAMKLSLFTTCCRSTTLVPGVILVLDLNVLPAVTR